MSEKSSESLRKSKLSTIGVVALIFSFVAAGAFGIEEAIAASGPGLTLIMLLVFPFVWAFPLCEMVGELGSILPSEGGIYSWGRESFGEFWGWQIGLWSALTTWMCQAQYCALVVGYAAKFIDMSPTAEYMAKNRDGGHFHCGQHHWSGLAGKAGNSLYHFGADRLWSCDRGGLPELELQSVGAAF